MKTFFITTVLLLLVATLACPAGKFAPDPSDTNTCEECPLGHYCNSNEKYPCEKGWYQSSYGATTCYKCGGVRYTDTTGSSSCKLCNGEITGDNTGCDNSVGGGDAGSGSGNTGGSTGGSTGGTDTGNNTDATICTPGKYPQDATCQPCDPGFYCPDGSAKLECSAGKYSSSTEATMCTECAKDMLPNAEKTGCEMDPTKMNILDKALAGDPVGLGIVGGVVLMIIILILMKIKSNTRHNKKREVIDNLQESSLYKRSYKMRSNAPVEQIQKYVKKMEEEDDVEANKYMAPSAGPRMTGGPQIGFENYDVEEGQLVSMLGTKLSQRTEFSGTSGGANPAMAAAALGGGSSPAVRKTIYTEGALTNDFAKMRGRASDRLTHVVKYGRRSMGGASTLGKTRAYANRKGMSVSMYNKY